MLGFTPFKKHANKFNYIPRYYDPEKEAREQRREELTGRRSDTPDSGEYRPGQYIRTQQEARNRRNSRSGSGRMKIWLYLGVAFVVLLFIQLLYPRLAALLTAGRQSAAVEEVQEWQDQYGATPITIVPNDYVEEEE